MAEQGNGKVVINLTAGHEDADRVTVAFLVGNAALRNGRDVRMFATKEAVRLGMPGYAGAISITGAPPVSELFEKFVDGGGELMLCPVCFNARSLDAEDVVPGASVAGGEPLFQWMGEEPATVFSY